MRAFANPLCVRLRSVSRARALASRDTARARRTQEFDVFFGEGAAFADDYEPVQQDVGVLSDDRNATRTRSQAAAHNDPLAQIVRVRRAGDAIANVYAVGHSPHVLRQVQIIQIDPDISGPGY